MRSGDFERVYEAATKKNGNIFLSPQVEPAFARAIDFVVGEKLAEWTKVSGRAALKLTAAGVKAANSVARADDALVKERSFLSKAAKELSEAAVGTLISQASRAA